LGELAWEESPVEGAETLMEEFLLEEPFATAANVGF